MKTFTRTSLFAVAAAVMIAGGAMASNHAHKAVFTKNGDAVNSQIGGCVVTKFQGHGGNCLSDEHRTVYFDFASSRLTAASKAKLDRLVADLSSAGIYEVRIVGFADRIGDVQSNRRLSQRRGDAVAQYLAAKGLSADLGFEIRGLGERSQSACKGKAGDALIKCLWRDRRVEIEVVR
jgi:outer membrane protein OmpA-like peptidoglycan-associated protein